jgi:hypothetical protein
VPNPHGLLAFGAPRPADALCLIGARRLRSGEHGSALPLLDDAQNPSRGSRGPDIGSSVRGSLVVLSMTEA